MAVGLIHDALADIFFLVTHDAAFSTNSSLKSLNSSASLRRRAATRGARSLKANRHSPASPPPATERVECPTLNPPADIPEHVGRICSMTSLNRLHRSAVSEFGCRNITSMSLYGFRFPAAVASDGHQGQLRVSNAFFRRWKARPPRADGAGRYRRDWPAARKFPARCRRCSASGAAGGSRSS